MYTHELKSIVFHGLLRPRRPQQSQPRGYAQIEGTTQRQPAQAQPGRQIEAELTLCPEPETAPAKAQASAPAKAAESAPAKAGESAPAEDAGNAAADDPANAPAKDTLHYAILSQSRQQMETPDNSPSISMWPYLLASGQTQRLNQISIYVQKGSTADQMRFLYMNEAALAVWAQMQKDTKIMGRLHRPPRGATLSFGMPFSE